MSSSYQNISPGTTTIWTPISKPIQRSQLNCEPISECHLRITDPFGTYPGPGDSHHTVPRRQLNCAKNAFSWPNLTHNRLDGHGVKFHRYMRLWQPDETWTGRIGDEYGVQFGSNGWRSLGQHQVNTLGGVLLNIRMISKGFRNRSTGGQPSRSTYTMVFGQCMRSGRVMHCGY